MYPRKSSEIDFPAQMERILANLVSNAVKYTEKDGAIKMLRELEVAPMYVGFKVTDKAKRDKYVTDLMEVLATADRESRFYIMVYFANHYLMMTGVFPDHIRHRAERKGAPQLAFYEEAGRRGFEMASNHQLAQAQEECFRLPGRVS